jgi:hypothetical protein
LPICGCRRIKKEPSILQYARDWSEKLQNVVAVTNGSCLFEHGANRRATYPIPRHSQLPGQKSLKQSEL